MALVAMAFVACDKGDDKGFEFNPNAKVYIRGYQETPKELTSLRGTKLFANNQKRLTAHEIVVKAFDMGVAMQGIRYSDGKDWGGSAFDNSQLDTVNNMFIKWASDIITYENKIGYDGFIGSHDMLFYDTKTNDTLAYIPNSAVENALPIIEELFERGEYDELYQVFQTAFTFYPCTGEEYKELKAQGLN